MTSSTRQYEGHPPEAKSGSTWLQAIIAVSVVILIVIAVLCIQIRSCRITAWQEFRNVMTQIESESYAKALFRRSPRLVSRFTNESRFLDYIKTYHSVIQIPPIVEPVKDGEKYSVFPLLISTSVRFRFEDGTTFSVGIKKPGFFRSYPVGQEVLKHFDIHATRMLTGQNH